MLLAGVMLPVGMLSVDTARSAHATPARVAPLPVRAPQIIVDVHVNDFVHDPVRDVIHATVSDTSPRHRNSIVTVDIETGRILASAGVGTRPNSLAISPDASTIYVGIDGRGAVQRFSLPSFEPGWSVALGVSFGSRVMTAGDIEVLPGASDSVAVARHIEGVSPGFAGVVVIDGGVQRPFASAGHTGSDSIVFGDDPDVLYGSDTESTFEGFQILTIDADGFRGDTFAGLGGGRLVFHDGLLYQSNGKIVDPSGPTLRDTMPLGTFVAIDAAAGWIVYATRGSAADGADIRAFDLVSKQPAGRWTVAAAASSDSPIGGMISAGPRKMALIVGGRLVIVELVEGPGAFGEFNPLPPSRILDTRDGTGRAGRTGPLGPAEPIEVQITGRGGVVDGDVVAVTMNVTVTRATEWSYLSVWPAGAAPPYISNLNFVPGQTTANQVTVAVGDGGRVAVQNSFGSAHVIFDVVGFYSGADGPSGSRFQSLDPARLFDTRIGSGGVPARRLGPGGSVSFDVLGSDVRGRSGLFASGVTAIVMNVTAARATEWSYLTVYPDDLTSPPRASSLNYAGPNAVANLVTVRVPPSGIVTFYNAFGSVDVIADVVGYFHDEPNLDAGRFVPFVPFRAFDSRDGGGTPLGRGSTWLIGRFPGFAGLPLGEADSVVLNVTATRATASSYLTVFPSHACELPTASNLNFEAGRTVPNQVVVRLANDEGCAERDQLETIAVYNHDGSTDVVIDVFGFYTSVYTTLF